jgi:hypothetical protein
MTNESGEPIKRYNPEYVNKDPSRSPKTREEINVIIESKKPLAPSHPPKRTK